MDRVNMKKSLTSDELEIKIMYFTNVPSDPISWRNYDFKKTGQVIYKRLFPDGLTLIKVRLYTPIPIIYK
jgi:hypothetical protein